MGIPSGAKRAISREVWGQAGPFHLCSCGFGLKPWVRCARSAPKVHPVQTWVQTSDLADLDNAAPPMAPRGKRRCTTSAPRRRAVPWAACTSDERMQDLVRLMGALGVLVRRMDEIRASGEPLSAEEEAFLELLAPAEEMVRGVSDWLAETDEAAEDAWDAFLREHPEL